MKNPILTILKAVAIILVVMAHSCCPTYLSRFCYMICVSLFFMASGYCFNTKYLNDEYTFVKRRFKGLYVPFVKWSIILLILHNCWFWIGILNEQYGNAAGGVTHPLNAHQWMQSLWSIVLNMSGYDQFLGGAFWFFRALLVSSIVFVFGFKFLERIPWKTENPRFKWLNYELRAPLLLALFALLLATWQKSEGLRWTGMPQSGYREIMGVFFLAAGYLYRQYEERLAKWWYAAAGLAAVILVVLTIWGHPSMGHKANSIADIYLLALSGIAGFCFIKTAASFLNKTPEKIRQGLLYIGDNTLYIFGWHLLAFKLVSMLKVAVYGLPWLMVGGHTVVNSGAGSWFWILYTIVGVAVPLGGIWIYRYLDAHYNINHYLAWLQTGLKYTALGITIASIYGWRGLRIGAIYSWRGLRYAAIKIWKFLRWLVIGSWRSVYSLCVDFVDTIKAGADVNEEE